MVLFKDTCYEKKNWMCRLICTKIQQHPTVRSKNLQGQKRNDKSTETVTTLLVI